MNIVIRYFKHIDEAKLNSALEKLDEAEQKTIKNILKNPKNNSETLSAELVRKFTQAAMRNLSHLTKDAELSIKNVAISYYQLATEELGLALEGLGINHIEQSALGMITDSAADEKFLQQNARYTILGFNGEKSRDNELKDIHAFILTKNAAGDFNAFSQQNASSNFTAQSLIPTDFISYCENMNLEKKEIDNTQYFIFTKDDGDNILIPLLIDGNSRILLQTEDFSTTEINSSQYNEIAELLLEALTKSITPSPEPKPVRALTISEISLIKNVAKAMTNPAAKSATTEIEDKIKAAVEESLETQKDTTAPKKAYRGIGIEACLTNLDENHIALKIEDIFEKNLMRFFIGNEKSPIAASDLKTKLAGKFILEVDNQNIGELAIKYGGKNNAEFSKAAISMFHGKGDLYFTIIDKIGGEKTKVRCQRNIFVTNNCEEAKNKLTDSKGVQYNPDSHGIEVLANNKEITAVVAANEINSK